MNREQRRQTAKNMGLAPGERLNLNAIMVQFDNGKAVYLDTAAVQIIDKETGKPLFQEVLEPIQGEVVTAPANTPREEFPDEEQSYTVRFDTPEGPMEYVQNGNWSGVRPVKE